MQELNIKLSMADKPELSIINPSGVATRILTENDEATLDNGIENILSFMRDNHSQDLAEEKKDELYGQVKEMWSELSGKNGSINHMNFSLVLYKYEREFLYNLLKNDISYDSDTIFYGLEVLDMLSSMAEKSKDKPQAADELVAYDMTTTDLHYLYHIIKEYKVKGLGKKSQIFASIIRRIAAASKVFNYYKNQFDDISKAIQVWVSSLDKGVSISEDDAIYQLIWGKSDTKPSFVLDVEGDEVDGTDETVQELN